MDRLQRFLIGGLLTVLVAGLVVVRLMLDLNDLRRQENTQQVIERVARQVEMFRDARGGFTFDEETSTLSNVRVVVQTASVFTGVDARDQHLRSGDFLDVETFPEMIFEADRSVLENREGTLAGRLTILGVTKPLTLAVTWNKSGESPLPGRPYVAGLSARGSFARSEFGMTYGVLDGLVGEDVELIIELEAHRQ